MEGYAAGCNACCAESVGGARGAIPRKILGSTTSENFLNLTPISCIVGNSKITFMTFSKANFGRKS